MTVKTDPPARKQSRTYRSVFRKPVALLSQKIVGQSDAMKNIVPYVYAWQAGGDPEGPPAGVSLLLDPTRTGKTITIEAIAELLHGNKNKLVKIDCADFQLDRESVAICEASTVPIFYFRFLERDVLNLIRGQFFQSRVVY